ncbi:tyrosine-type recombinase/integrase [Paenisporosarcina sp. TG-14]|uniref:tyrosine-type recombinase/integrase n=1 Tax=Paenisporosarcina sp. TG-14 TaxID=1231057 RepID=UPI0002E950DF|nr:tyrosine-type recombinase/integrase [Paenisporosarcina sp. TG-14]
MKCDKLDSGVWECVADGPRDPITNKRNQIRRRSKTKSAAKKKVEEEISKIETYGVNGKRVKSLTFDDVAWEWLGVYSLGKIKASTIRSRTSSIKVLLRYIAGARIEKIDSRALQNILTDMDLKGNSVSTMENVKVTAGLIFKYAFQHKMRIDNPISYVVVPKKVLTVEEIENTTIEEKYFERSELEEFLETATTNGLYLDKEWFFLLAFTGIRAGEMCALKWTDVFFDRKAIRITKTIDMPNHNMRKYELTPPKTKASIREIEVDDETMDMLKHHKIIQAKIKLSQRQRHADYHDQNFVFNRTNGYPYSPRMVYDRTLRIIKKTSITKLEGPHIFRHTHITMLAESGVDLKTIMDRVGHEDSKTTTEVYMHVTEKMKKDAPERLKVHYGNILKLPKQIQM